MDMDLKSGYLRVESRKQVAVALILYDMVLFNYIIDFFFRKERISSITIPMPM